MLHHKSYLNSENNDWILLIHGIGGNTNTWKKQLTEFRKKANLLIVDLPGHGRSKSINIQQSYSLNILSETVWDIVEQNKIAKLQLVGVSLGALIALKINNKHPKRIKSTVITGAMLQLSFPIRLFFNTGIFVSELIGFYPYYRLIAKYLLPEESNLNLKKKMAKEAISKNKTEIRKWIRFYKSLNKELKILFRMPNPTQTLIVLGSKDRFLIKASKQYQQLNKNVRIEIVQKCGHVVQIEKPDVFNNISLNFIRSPKS